MTQEVIHNKRDDCDCPLCKLGYPGSRLIPAELPDGRKVTLRLSNKAYVKLQQRVAFREASDFNRRINFDGRDQEA